MSRHVTQLTLEERLCLNSASVFNDRAYLPTFGEVRRVCMDGVNSTSSSDHEGDNTDVLKGARGMGSGGSIRTGIM